MDEEDIQHTKEIIIQLKTNLRILEMQAAKSGIIDRSLRIENEIRDTQKEIERLQARINDTKNGSGTTDIYSEIQHLLTSQETIFLSLSELSQNITDSQYINKQVFTLMNELSDINDRLISSAHRKSDIVLDLMLVASDHFEESINTTTNTLIDFMQRIMIFLAVVFPLITACIIFGIFLNRVEFFLVISFLCAGLFMILEAVKTHLLRRDMKRRLEKDEVDWRSLEKELRRREKAS